MKHGRANAPVAAVLLGLFLFTGCAQTIPKEALQLSPESLQNRQLQTKRFDTDELTLLNASTALLQDLGFLIDESTPGCGVLVCSKRRDATDAGQIVGYLALGILTGVYVPPDRDQLIRASLVTRPLVVNEEDKSKSQTAVRVTFQRIVWNQQGHVTKQELINEPPIYQDFFDKLSQSLFLEAHEL